MTRCNVQNVAHSSVGLKRPGSVPGAGHLFQYVTNQPPKATPGPVNEYQLRLGRQRQVWFIPLADKRGVCR